MSDWEDELNSDIEDEKKTDQFADEEGADQKAEEEEKKIA